MISKENEYTIPQIIRGNYEKRGYQVAMCMKKFGIWQKYSWKDYYENVKYFSLGLVSLGLEPGDVLCIIGDNEPEWFWAQFATQAAGGIATGIFVDSIPSEVKYIATHSDAKFAVVNDQEQTDKFLEIKDELPLLKKVIYWDPKGLKNYDDPILISFTEVTKLGKEYEKTYPDLFEQNVDKIKEDDTAFIYYTSGTTGLPKGAALTHRALINTAQGFISRYPLGENDDLISNFPAAWVGDSFFATIPHLLTGARLNFPEEPETIAEDTREVGPNFIIYGPRQWEGLVSEIQVKMLDAHPLKRFTYNLFLPVGYRIADIKLQGKIPNLFWRALHVIAYWLLFRPLKDKLGLSKIRFAVTGSSVLSLDTFRLIHAIGIELRQNYASTEAGLISSHGKGEIKFESVGRPALGTEVRITDEGELLVRSDCMFNGYHKNPEKTATALIDGWCHTGDAVNINEAGHLIFMDRLEHMGELSSGIDFAMVGKWAERNSIPYTTFVDLSQKKEVADLVQKDLLRVNSYLPEPARVRRFVLMHKEFDPDEAELTRTRKLRRDFMEERYKDLIDTIYKNETEINLKTPVTYRDGRKGVVTTSIKVRTVSEGYTENG